METKMLTLRCKDYWTTKEMLGYFCGMAYEDDTKAVYKCYFVPDYAVKYSAYELTEEQETYLERELGDEYWFLPYGKVVHEFIDSAIPEDEYDWEDEE